MAEGLYTHLYNGGRLLGRGEVEKVILPQRQLWLEDNVHIKRRLVDRLDISMYIPSDEFLYTIQA